MRNYTAHDIKDMFDSYKQHVSHVIVAHTYHRPYVANTNVGRFKHVRADSYLKQKLVETSKDTRYALNCFNNVEFNRKLIKKGPNVQLKIDHVLNPTCLVIRQEAQGDHNGHD